VKTLDPQSKQAFIKNINESAQRRYIYKTGNDFDGLKKFTYGDNTTVL
jgi:hypothetical protein